MPIFFDVGANNGSSTINIAKDSPDNTVYAFEPTPRMIDIIRSRTSHLKNYHIVEKAVADYEGSATFYVSGQDDWGCSSLNTFNDNLEATWPGRTDFKVTDSLTVDVIRLDSFIEAHGIDEIEYFHCDAQGKDLEVLVGAGEHIRKIKRGVVEMPTRHDTKLYKDQKFIADDAIAYLLQHGFEIEGIQINDVHNNECNVFFRRA
ncbi:hypothetical protein ATCVMN08101_400L [Acanthocystis turfacea Chlorella virus MN0810.1]|nr:hypothetical protein ATCVMN08101_400L [Acanthocystis turfacea Chlorella virus MN0810.1]